MSSFIDLETGIGRLVLAGIVPTFEQQHVLGFGTANLLRLPIGEPIVGIFKDGTRYVVRESRIAEAIEFHNANKEKGES